MASGAANVRLIIDQFKNALLLQASKRAVEQLKQNISYDYTGCCFHAQIDLPWRAAIRGQTFLKCIGNFWSVQAADTRSVTPQSINHRIGLVLRLPAVCCMPYALFGQLQPDFAVAWSNIRAATKMVANVALFHDPPR